MSGGDGRAGRVPAAQGARRARVQTAAYRRAELPAEPLRRLADASGDIGILCKSSGSWEATAPTAASASYPAGQEIPGNSTL